MSVNRNVQTAVAAKMIAARVERAGWGARMPVGYVLPCWSFRPHPNHEIPRFSDGKGYVTQEWLFFSVSAY